MLATNVGDKNVINFQHSGKLSPTFIKPKGDGKFHWSVVDPDFQFTKGKGIHSHSLVTVQTPNEYVLLIGGRNEDFQILDLGFMNRSIPVGPR